jgi:hypothetical protein
MLIVFFTKRFREKNLRAKNFARMIDRAKKFARIKVSGEGKILKEGEKNPN